MVYVGQTRSRKLIGKLAALGYGECTNRGEYPPRRRPFFLDNGAFADYRAGRPWSRDAWLRELDKVRGAGDQPDFVVAPDVVAGGRESLDLSLACLPELEGFRAYLVVQDGMTQEDVRAALPGFAGIFVGGTVDWKLATGAAWCQFAEGAGVPCHIGRVGTARRVRWAVDVRPASIDSCVPLWSADNLRVFINALSARRQVQFWGNNEATAGA